MSECRYPTNVLVFQQLEEYGDEVRKVPRKYQHQYSITFSQYKHQLATIKRELVRIVTPTHVYCN